MAAKSCTGVPGPTGSTEGVWWLQQPFGRPPSEKFIDNYLHPGCKQLTGFRAKTFEEAVEKWMVLREFGKPAKNTMPT